MLAHAVTVTFLLSAALVASKPQLRPRMTEIRHPEYYMLPAVPFNLTTYPLGASDCDRAVRNVMDLSHPFLNSIVDRNYQCRHDGGFRKTITPAVQDLAEACQGEAAQFENIVGLFDQIAYATSRACDWGDESCDLQAELVLAMMGLDMGTTENRHIQCSPCVTRAFGRMSARDPPIEHKVIMGKSLCNKHDDEYCEVDGFRPLANICHPCNQRYFVKRLLVGDLVDGAAQREQDYVRACYDDGEGDTCFNKVSKVLQRDHNVAIDADGRFVEFGDLQVCAQPDACHVPECISVVETLIKRVGCCAPTLPLLLLRNLDLQCLDDMIESKVGLEAACYDPVTSTVDFDIQCTDEYTQEELSEFLRKDLATTLAVLPGHVTSRPKPCRYDNRYGFCRYSATIKHYRSIGMPDAVQLSLDLVQGHTFVAEPL